VRYRLALVEHDHIWLLLRVFLRGLDRIEEILFVFRHSRFDDGLHNCDVSFVITEALIESVDCLLALGCALNLVLLVGYALLDLGLSVSLMLRV
jgi:hypothetical protein